MKDMLDKIIQIEKKYIELGETLSDPAVIQDYNKFREMNLTPEKTEVVDSVLVKESPLSIECKVKQIIPLGSHDMFIAEVVNVLADEKYMDKDSDAFLLEEAKLIAYNHGNYYKIGEKIGKFGWSVQKKK